MGAEQQSNGDGAACVATLHTLTVKIVERGGEDKIVLLDSKGMEIQEIVVDPNDLITWTCADGDEILVFEVEENRQPSGEILRKKGSPFDDWVYSKKKSKPLDLRVRGDVSSGNKYEYEILVLVEDNDGVRLVTKDPIIIIR